MTKDEFDKLIGKIEGSRDTEKKENRLNDVEEEDFF